jgi:hemerythrin superfamily protein
MNVYEVLKQDHQEARNLFQEIEGLGPSNTRQQLFLKLKDLLTRHQKAEEKVFYPKLQDRKQTHDLIEEAVHEHHEAEHLIEEIEALPPDSDQWLQAVQRLRQAVEHHVQEEENEVFPKAQPLLAGQDDSLGDEIKRAEQAQQPTRH